MTTSNPSQKMKLFKELKLNELIASSINPRTEFEETSLNELAESIKLHGVLQPIIVRIHPVEKRKYEIVCGERRFRASKIAGAKTISTSVRELNDDEVFEIQIIENLARKDVHAMDEALAFKKMLESGKYTLDDISAKIVKPLTFVSQRLKLNDLIPELKEDFLKGEFGLGHAVLLARVSEEKQKEIFDNSKREWGNGYGTIKELKSDLDDDNLNLDEAFFDISDITLDPLAGACTACLKCSKSNSVLFPEYEENLCFDKVCFSTKTEVSKRIELNKVINENHGIILVCRYPDSKTKALISFAESFGKKVLTGWNSYEIKDNGNDAYDLENMELIKIEKRDNLNAPEISKSDPDQEIKSNILGIKQRADRALELDREKIFKRSIEELIKNDEKNPILFSTDDLTLTEKVTLCFILMGYDDESWMTEQYGVDIYEFRKDKFEIILKHFSEGMLWRIIRKFIKKELVSESILDYEKYDQPKAYIKILNEYFPKEILQFTEDQTIIAKQRIERANVRITDLENSLKIRENERELQKSQIDSSKLCKSCNRNDIDFINEFGHPAIWNEEYCLPCSLKQTDLEEN
ncbi:ParB/RepB/Spo0J family partition protein [Chryseobacterium antibioticum]|uniref:ParB/RepB/Spo0J family partition protein n=1 Tax=Chryseobacterium pyrolae TaxID=2987481 RepID=A0ABT2IMX9_9FLAO|nr:ParB/RepB/Spo0J family partition protein [Chryseobacterium pyrolae]MCT2410010.1 ParB/RepB/Spo0J family partition protein [Chryseobacterium pyrolae]